MSDSDDSAAFRFTKEEMQLLTLHRAFLLSACAQAQPAAVVDIIVAYWCPAMAALRHTVGMGKSRTSTRKKKPEKEEVKAVTEEEETTEVGEEGTPGESEENTEESPKKPTTLDEEKEQTEEETLDEEENGDKDNKEEQTVEALRKQVAELQKQVGQLSKGRDRGRTRDWMNDEQLKDIQNVKDQHKP